MSNSPSQHLIIAEWILERGEAVNAHDASEKFGIPNNREHACLATMERDKAITTKRSETTSGNARQYDYDNTVKKITVIAIDRDKRARRKMRPSYNDQQYPLYPVSDLTRAEKWE
ncbi:hypothetical protein HB016_004775 [Salmonella enterica subsp. enterica]|uniref:CaiF/GrlA family transcriptional regulator n=1 Tax=Salmonella enterica TaxID=28901 RepID=A0A633DM03_SALER|nr:hypothetical protein [Salmonella enterica]EBQ9476266.1 hypothetical protein [Salmonella enterica subsp. enterica serovar Kokomlemle]EBW2603600.1 hypothetical protein [Salmonella enterica subsp. enterica serovar Poano]EBA1657710.1 hypothetical protein [Salmonella enterica]EBE9328201.1 hypothetical protein [Salmonella enterica]